MKPSILIRTDGNSRIGLGHLVRCTALAQMLKDHFMVSFYCMEIPKILKKELESNGFDCTIIENEEEFIDEITRSTIVVLDGYNFDINYQKRIKGTGSKLIYIDDMHDKEIVADLIINYTPWIKPDDYKTRPDSKLALGLKYALLRPLFIKQISKLRTIEKIETALICFGGSDPNRFTEQALEVTLKVKQLKKIIVVTGISYKFTRKFEKNVSNDLRIILHKAISEQEMLDIMISAEMAILPASTILLELFTVGTPVISGYYVENQREASIYFKNHGATLDLGNMNLDFKVKLSEQLKNIFEIDYNNMILRQKNLMGRGNTEIVKLIKDLKIA